MTSIKKKKRKIDNVFNLELSLISKMILSSSLIKLHNKDMYWFTLLNITYLLLSNIQIYNTFLAKIQTFYCNLQDFLKLILTILFDYSS